VSVIFRALVGTVAQTLTNLPEVQVRETGASIDRNEVVKLKYLQLSIDPDGLLLAGLASVSGIFEYMGGEGVGWEFRHDLIITGAGIGETTKDWFFPDDFPEFEAETVTFTVDCANIEFDQIMTYKLIYEIRNASALEILQSQKNFIQFGMG
jgi:hypothetical protein